MDVGVFLNFKTKGSQFPNLPFFLLVFILRKSQVYGFIPSRERDRQEILKNETNQGNAHTLSIYNYNKIEIP